MNITKRPLKLKCKCAYCEILSHLPVNITTTLYILSTVCFLCVIQLTRQATSSLFNNPSYKLHHGRFAISQWLWSLYRFITADHFSMRMVHLKSTCTEGHLQRTGTLTAQTQFRLLAVYRWEAWHLVVHNWSTVSSTENCMRTYRNHRAMTHVNFSQKREHITVTTINK